MTYTLIINNAKKNSYTRYLFYPTLIDSVESIYK